MQCIALCAVLWIQGKCVYESVLQSVLNKNDLVASACNLYKKEILKVFFFTLDNFFKKNRDENFISDKYWATPAVFCYS